MISRRGLMAAAPVAPLMAKAALDMQIGRDCYLTTSGMKLNEREPQERLDPELYGTNRREARLCAVAEHVKLFGLPPGVDEHYRRRARHVSGLDPDIANKQSWSMAVKIMSQRQRNYERSIEHIQEEGAAAHARTAAMKALGLDWWPW